MSNALSPFLSVYYVPGSGNQRESPSLRGLMLSIHHVVRAMLCFGDFFNPLQFTSLITSGIFGEMWLLDLY